MQVSYEEQQQAFPLGTGGDAVVGPRLGVTAEALEAAFGIIVLTAKNQQDLEAALKIIEYIQKLGAAAEIQVQMVPLIHADAVSLSNQLGIILQRLNIGPNATILLPAGARALGGAPTGAAASRAAANRAAVSRAAASKGGGQQGGGLQGGQQGGGLQRAAAWGPRSFSNRAVPCMFYPIPRLNSLLVAARYQICEMARPASPHRESGSSGRQGHDSEGRSTSSRASAVIVAQQIQQFYATRYPGEPQTLNMIRITSDPNNNTVYVQAAPADMTTIAEMIDAFDQAANSAVSDLLIIRLNNAIADDLAAIVQKAITTGYNPPSLTGTGGLLGGQQPGAAPAGGFGQAGATPNPFPPVTKTSTVRFFSGRKDATKPEESSVLEDVRIISEPRINSLIVAAPENTMRLILALVRDLDVAPAARAEINIFTLKRADAAALANSLQQLFLGTGTAGRLVRYGRAAALVPLGGLRRWPLSPLKVARVACRARSCSRSRSATSRRKACR